MFQRTRSARSRARGFTLMELMVVLAVAGVILSVAVPNFREFIRNNRLTSAANDLLAAVTLARTEAIKRQVPVAVCATADPFAAVPVCSGAWTQGPPSTTAWVVWVDDDNDWIPDNSLNEPVLLRHEALDNTITIRSDNSGRLKYLATGFTAPPALGFSNTRNLALCDERGTVLTGNGSAARALRVSATGRVRVTRDKVDVENALADIGAGVTCP